MEREVTSELEAMKGETASLREQGVRLECLKLAASNAGMLLFRNDGDVERAAASWAKFVLTGDAREPDCIPNMNAPRDGIGAFRLVRDADGNLRRQSEVDDAAYVAALSRSPQGSAPAKPK